MNMAVLEYEEEKFIHNLGAESEGQGSEKQLASGIEHVWKGS